MLAIICFSLVVAGRLYTMGDPQMKEEIRAIMRIKDYYQVLGLSRDCEEVAIKNAYRRLAVKFHPDKNKEQGAKEAFNKISTAYSTLIDRDKRADYDRYGSEEDLQRQAAQAQRRYRYQQAEFDDFNDLFMRFFQDNMFNERVGPSPRAHPRRQAEPQSFRMLQFVLVIVLAYMLLPALFRTKPYFSL